MSPSVTAVQRRPAGQPETLPAPCSLARWTAGLALGSLRDGGAVRWWPAVLEFAVRERCAALAWLRSRQMIQAHAPPGVAERWRVLFRNISARGHAQLVIAAGLENVLQGADIEVITLKGAPLAARLDGDPAVRATTDTDWYISALDRARAREAINGQGWDRDDGGPAGEETFARMTPHGRMYLDVHPSLLHPRFNYLPVPRPESERIVVDGVALRAHSGPLVPGYLAAHLAGHERPPLLLHLDLMVLWGSLTERERAAARAAAARAGLDRYLAWAVRRVDVLTRGVEGVAAAWRELGFASTRQRVPHPMWRHVRLAPGLRGAWRAAAGWIVPPWLDAEFGGVIRGTAHRVRRYGREALFGVAPPRGRNVEAPSHPCPLEIAQRRGAHVLEVARAVTRTGGEMWIVVTGHSMQPTIAPGDQVLLSPLGERVRSGDVVLADLGGRPVLHRVAGVSDAGVVLRGDGCDSSDPMVERGDLVARAIAVSRRGRVAPLAANRRFGASGLAHLAASKARLVVARVARRRSSRRGFR